MFSPVLRSNDMRSRYTNSLTISSFEGVCTCVHLPSSEALVNYKVKFCKLFGIKVKM
jgi:hypothetical protein